MGQSLLHLFSAKNSKRHVKRQTMDSIHVTTIQGDTIEALFSMYPDPESTFVERLSTFYSLNPHLRNQELIGGLSVKLPLSKIGQGYLQLKMF